MARASENFIKTIKEYLDNFASKNKLFKEKYSNPNKNINECCGYIVEEVRKMNVEGLTDEEVYYLARHYYEEEDLKAKPFSGANVVVNHQVTLTDEEKEKLKKEAEEEYKQEQIEKLEDEARKKAQQEEKASLVKERKQEQKIEKQKKKNEDDGLISLFDF